MSITVCKFGGSSVSDAGMFVRVNRIIRSNPARKYIVLSAPGKRCPDDEKITDLFYRAYEASCSGDDSILAEIFNRYASIRNALAPEFNLEEEFAKIRSDLHISPDYAASRGEYLCAKLFAAYAGLPFVDSADILLFNTSGEPDIPASFSAVRSRLLPLECAIIPGFYGSRPDGSIQTFTRGGSDVSGSILAAALQADLYENWTDVDGLFTADPAIVPEAQRNLEVDLHQMERIAAAGAKLLHPDALKPLHGTGIPTILKNTFTPGAPGTLIHEGVNMPAKCVTGKRSLYMIGDPVSATTHPIDPLLHSIPLPGSLKVSVISVFGLPADRISQIQSTLNPIHIIHMQDHIEIIIPDREYEASVCTVHGILCD